MEKDEDPNEEGIHIFKNIIDHHRKDNRNEVKILWEDVSETWCQKMLLSRSQNVSRKISSSLFNSSFDSRIFCLGKYMKEAASTVKNKQKQARNCN